MEQSIFKEVGEHLQIFHYIRFHPPQLFIPNRLSSSFTLPTAVTDHRNHRSSFDLGKGISVVFLH